MKKRIFGCMFVFFCLGFAFSSGLLISPAKIELSNYNASEEFDITVTNDRAQDAVIELSYESWEGKVDYLEYFSAVDYPDNKIEINAGEAKTIHFIMKYPELEQFGTVRFTTIRFYQVPVFSQGSQVAATVAIRIPVETQVPYPEKYVKVDIEDHGVFMPNESIELRAILTNLGLEDLQEVSGNFILTKEEKSYVYSFENANALMVGESVEVLGEIAAGELEKGKYDLALEIFYDGEGRRSDEVDLVVGENVVEILELDSLVYTAGVSDTVTVSLLNYWIEDVTLNLRADILSKNGKILESVDYGEYTLEANELKKISNGFDFRDYEVGEYGLHFYLIVDEDEEDKNFLINLISTSEFNAPEVSLKFPLIVIVILILFFAVLYFYRRRKG